MNAYYERRNLSRAHKIVVRKNMSHPTTRIIAYEDLPSLNRMAKDGGYWVIDEYGNREWVNIKYSIYDVDLFYSLYDFLGSERSIF